MPDFQRDITLTGGGNDLFVAPGDYDYWLYNPPTNSSVTISKAGKAPILISAGEVFVLHLSKGEEISLSGTAGQTISILDHADVKLIPAAKDILGKVQIADSSGSPVATVRAANTSAPVSDPCLEVKIVALGASVSTATAIPVTLPGGSVATTQSTSPWIVAGNQGEAAVPTAGKMVEGLVAKDGSGNLQFIPLTGVSGGGFAYAADVPVVIDTVLSNQNGNVNVSQQGVVAASLGTPTTNSFAGNTTLTPGACILKSVLLTGTANANKVLQLGGNQISSKTGATLPADMLDREIAVPSATTIGVANGVAGDTVRVTYLTLP